HQGDLAVVHNGNITNARILREELVAEGALFQSATDTEVLVHLIARSREPTPEAQLRDALRQLEGAFSIIVTIGSTLYAARDPWGFRPLILGRRDGGHVVRSEEHTSELQSRENLVCRLLLEKKKRPRHSAPA